MSRFFVWVKAHIVLSLFILLLLVGVGYAFYPKPPVSPYETVKVERLDLIQEVTVTGRVESQESIDLSFEKGGKIVAVGASVGERVLAGDTILRLDGSDLSASLDQARANRAFEEATLEKLLKGARPEEIQVSQVTLENAESSLEDAQSGLREYITDGYTKTDDAIRNKTDIFFSNPRVDPQLTIPVSDFKLSLDVVNLRKALEVELLAWNTRNSRVATEDIALHVSDAKKALDDAKRFLESIALVVNAIAPSSNVTQTTIDGWKASVSSARTGVNTAVANLSASEEKWRSAKSAVALSAQQLALKKVGATPEEISAQKARIASAQASVASYQSQVSKLSLVAPFAGVVTTQDGKKGAIASPSVTLVSIQSEGLFKIEANVPEVDIAKLSEGDTAYITLDAYGDGSMFTGSIVMIDPSGREIEGVPTYKITLGFEDKEGKVRSGMTANVRITADTRKGVLAVPARAIKESKTESGVRVVRVLDALGTAVERTVEVGLRGSEGKTEILSGLSEGEDVITFEKKVP